MFHLRCLCSITRGLPKLPLELRVGQLNGRDLWIDTKRNHVIIDQFAYLGTNI